jgi:hypothetical protein
MLNRLPEHTRVTQRKPNERSAAGNKIILVFQRSFEIKTSFQAQRLRGKLTLIMFCFDNPHHPRFYEKILSRLQF